MENQKKFTVKKDEVLSYYYNITITDENGESETVFVEAADKNGYIGCLKHLGYKEQ